MTDHRTFRVFVSSTFGDMKVERDVLQRVVFPRLRQLAARHDCRFQAIDLRWGVREEAALDQRTMKICLTEIARCQQVSPRPNFLVLLGQRYGWRPLPSAIPEKEFAAILERVRAEDRDLLEWRRQQPDDAKGWYRRDDNAVPPLYELQPREGEFVDPDRWAQEEARVLGILEGASAGLSLSEEARLKYGASATEQEIVKGALAVPDAREHVFCFFRTLRGLPENASDYLDRDAAARQRLANLQEQLRQRLPGNVIAQTVDWNNGQFSFEYLTQFAHRVYRRLARLIKAEVVKRVARDPVDDEIAAHARFSVERRRTFVGRLEVLAGIRAYATANRRTALAVIGPPGSGKSALLARAGQESRAVSPAAPVVERYIGVTPASSNVRSLLESLCHEIGRAYAANALDLPSEYRELVQEFPRRLALATADRPLVIVLDALDQLTTADNGRSLAWLPAALPAHVSLLCSATLGDCAAVLEQKLPPAAHLQLTPLRPDEGDEVLGRWLVEAGRTLQPAQREVVREAFGHSGLPLWLKLAFEEARLWPSYAPADPTCLAADVPGIISQLFERLSDEANHGPVLVAHALGYLGTARNGLTENELLDVLALDPEVMGDVRGKARHELAELAGRTPLPVVLWSRLFFDLEPYLTERAADEAVLMTFYHRQIGEAVRDHFLVEDMERRRHTSLATYFGAHALTSGEPGKAHVNLRKLSELPFQLAHAGDWPGLYETLTHPAVLCTMCETPGLGVDRLLADLQGAATEWYRADGDHRPPPSHQVVYSLLYAELWAEAANIRRYRELTFQQLWHRIRWRQGFPVACKEKFRLYGDDLRTQGRMLLCSRLPPQVIDSSLIQTVHLADRPIAATMSPLGVLTITRSGTWSVLDSDGLVQHEGAGAPGVLRGLRANNRHVVGLSGQNLVVWGQLPSEPPLLFRTGWPISALDLSAACDRLIVASENGEWVVYSLAGPRPSRMHQGTLHASVSYAVITPDGRNWILATSDGRVWLGNEEMVQQVAAEGPKVRMISVSGDGRRYLVVHDNGQMEIREIANTVLYHGEANRCVTSAFLREDGETAITVDDKGRCLALSQSTGTWRANVLTQSPSYR